ncbi:uncharacterized protein HGUI_03066 [Hanseniaspora guilliermondii]|uniref:Uncharacterized protein n=1 Tax=Hanseniaspora guilliermondii TaxID=56406 RepID=A0A1L0B3A5_9ASCO|nr:uncharacterized protein HGUI_03066 [Hanseniaspora guilliermondii]
MSRNHVNSKIVSGAASRAVASSNINNLQSKSNLRKEVFEHKDCIIISTYQSLYTLETCHSIVEAIIDNIDESEDTNLVMLSSIIATFVYTHDFNNSRILKKRMQLLMNNKLVKTTSINENDSFIGYGALNFKNEFPDMNKDNVTYEEFKKKQYDPIFQRKVLNNLKVVLENEIGLLHQKMKQLKHKATYDFTKQMNSYFDGLMTEIIKIYDIIPQFAVVLDDEPNETFHLLTGLQIMSNIHHTLKEVYYNGIVKFIDTEIMEFKNTLYSLHQLYGALLAQNRIIVVLVNMIKQFLQTNLTYINTDDFNSQDDSALNNIIQSLMQIDAKVLTPSSNLCSQFCVENSMLVNQNINVVINLKQKYTDKLNDLFMALSELITDMNDVLMYNFDEDTTTICVDPYKNYFKNFQKQKDINHSKFTYTPTRLNSFEPNKRHHQYNHLNEGESLNSKIARSASAFSQMSISSQESSPMNSRGNSRQNSLTNNKKQVRKRTSSVSSNSSNVNNRSRSSSVNSMFKNSAIQLTSNLEVKKNGHVSRVSTNESTKSQQNDRLMDLQTQCSSNTSIENEEETKHDLKKVRFDGVPKYPMGYESIKPTRQGWYAKPAVLHYPMIPDQYTSNIDSFTATPVSKQRQMEGFAFKHINALFKKVRD